MRCGRRSPRTHMKTPHPIHRPQSLALTLGLFLGAIPLGTASGAVNLINSVNFNSGTALYEYSYSIQNTGSFDLALVSVPAGNAANVIGITAPTGFALTFDPSQGWINFNEDNDIFTEQTFAAGTTVSAFTFRSALAPGSVTFTAYDVSGTEFTGTTLSPVPEPSVSLLGGIAITAGLAKRRRSPSK